MPPEGAVGIAADKVEGKQPTLDGGLTTLPFQTHRDRGDPSRGATITASIHCDAHKGALCSAKDVTAIAVAGRTAALVTAQALTGPPAAHAARPHAAPPRCVLPDRPHRRDPAHRCGVPLQPRCLP